METSLLPNIQACEREAKSFAQRLLGHEVILFSGPLGIGKSTFIRALLRALGCTEKIIPSPTFTLMETYSLKYPGPCKHALHADLYRLVATHRTHPPVLAETHKTTAKGSFHNTNNNHAHAFPKREDSPNMLANLDLVALPELREVIHADTLVLIEWGESFDELRQHAHYQLDFRFNNNQPNPAPTNTNTNTNLPHKASSPPPHQEEPILIEHSSTLTITTLQPTRPTTHNQTLQKLKN